MAPISLLAAFSAFRNWQLGKGLVALTLGAACFAYATASSLGFVAGARDTATAERTARLDAYAIAKGKASAANAELAALAETPRGNRKVEEQRASRRADLEQQRADAERVMAATGAAGIPDPTAAALATYAGFLGFAVKAEDVSPWLALMAVVFFELGASTSLVVLFAAFPPRPAPKPTEAAAAEPAPKEEDGVEAQADAPAAVLPARKGNGGRRPSVPSDRVLRRLAGNGGTLTGSLEDIATQLGFGSRSSAHRALTSLADEGQIRLTATPAGTEVQLAN